jgi:coiled-coil domain-containing protein 63/114
LQLLKDKTENEKMMHVQEMRELQRMLDHDAKLLEFLEIKGHKRSSADMDAREAEKQRKEQEGFERQIDEYETIIERILKFTHEESVEALMASYQRKEDENFAMFNYVNEVTYEVETLTEIVQQIQDNIGEFGFGVVTWPKKFQNAKHKHNF